MKEHHVYTLPDAAILERPGPRYNDGLAWLIGVIGRAEAASATASADGKGRAALYDRGATDALIGKPREGADTPSGAKQTVP